MRLALAFGAFALLSLSLGSVARADETALRARLEALGTIAETETDLASAARSAIERSVRDRGLGDEARATRAERIAEATIALIERRRARLDAAERLRAAQAERDAMRQRLADGHAAAASDERERTRLAPPEPAPPEPASPEPSP